MSGKFLELSTDALASGDKKIKLTLLDDGTKGSNVSEIAGQTVVDGNTATFTKVSGSLKSNESLKLMCKYDNGKFAMISAADGAPSDGVYTFNLQDNDSSDLTDVTDVKVLVCQDNGAKAGDIVTTGYSICYAKEVVAPTLKGTVSIDNTDEISVLSADNDYKINGKQL